VNAKGKETYTSSPQPLHCPKTGHKHTEEPSNSAATLDLFISGIPNRVGKMGQNVFIENRPKHIGKAGTKIHVKNVATWGKGMKKVKATRLWALVGALGYGSTEERIKHADIRRRGTKH